MNILQRIQKLVMSAESFDFAVYDLKNGGKIECDTETLEIGSIVSVVKEDGSKELAPVGEHTLADGRTIVLDDESKVTEIKESDAPTATEVEAKKEEKMALEVAPDLLNAVSEMIKAKAAGLNEEDVMSLAQELIYAITAYGELSESEAEAEDSTTTAMKDMQKKFSELSAIVLDMAKSQEKFSANVEQKLSKTPSGKAISEMEFTSGPEVIDPLAARIEAIKNLNK